MGVNSLPKTVIWQRRGCDLNPGPFASESSTLTTRLPSQPHKTIRYEFYKVVQQHWLGEVDKLCNLLSSRVPFIFKFNSVNGDVILSFETNLAAECYNNRSYSAWRVQLNHYDTSSTEVIVWWLSRRPLHETVYILQHSDCSVSRNSLWKPLMIQDG